MTVTYIYFATLEQKPSCNTYKYLLNEFLTTHLDSFPGQFTLAVTACSDN